MPRVTIVLPTHNRAGLLPSAIESVLGQTFSDWELIVVDDGSTDETPRIIADFMARDPRVRSVRNDPNVRLPRALNRGFELALGEYLTWTSDDNLYRPLAIEELVLRLDASPECGLVYASMMIVDDELKPIREWAAKPVESQPVLPWCGACFLYRREVAEKVGAYDPERFLAEDLDYWVRMRIQAPMMSMDEELYLYREHESSLSSTRTEEVRQQSARVVESHWARLHWLTKRSRGETALGLAEAALRRGDMKGLRNWLRVALPRCPDLVIRHFKRGLLAAIIGR